MAPLYFRGEIELGVVTQSNSAFSHILNDVSLVVLQLEVLASFSAVVDRLGEFAEALESSSSVRSGIAIADRRAGAAGKTLLEARGLTLWTPKGTGEERGKRRQEVTAEVVAGAGTEKGGGNGVSEVAGRGGNGVAEVKGDDVAQGREGVGQVLVREMELEVVEGRSLLVMGPSGAGKTTILR